MTTRNPHSIPRVLCADPFHAQRAEFNRWRTEIKKALDGREHEISEEELAYWLDRWSDAGRRMMLSKQGRFA